MTFQSDYNAYCKAVKNTDKFRLKIADFFSRFNLEYSITAHAGDGITLLDHESNSCANLSENDVLLISQAKNRDDILKVINNLSFHL